MWVSVSSMNTSAIHQGRMVGSPRWHCMYGDWLLQLEKDETLFRKTLIFPLFKKILFFFASNDWCLFFKSCRKAHKFKVNVHTNSYRDDVSCVQCDEHCFQCNKVLVQFKNKSKKYYYSLTVVLSLAVN